MDYVIEFPRSIELYKGVTSGDLDNKLSMPSWFALNIDQAKSYMNSFADINESGELYKFVLKRDIKLLNVLDLKFKLDFWNRCNEKYSINDPTKLKALVAIGIVDLKTQEMCVRDVTNSCDRLTHLQANALGGHRCSSPDGDRNFVKALMEIYGTSCDGYILPTEVPSCFHGVFHREVCIFDCKDIFESKTFLEGITIKKDGGQRSKKHVDDYWYERDKLTKADWEDKPDTNKYDMFGNYKGSYIEQLKDIQRKNRKILKGYKQTPV